MRKCTIGALYDRAWRAVRLELFRAATVKLRTAVAAAVEEERSAAPAAAHTPAELEVTRNMGRGRVCVCVLCVLSVWCVLGGWIVSAPRESRVRVGPDGTTVHGGRWTGYGGTQEKTEKHNKHQQNTKTKERKTNKRMRGTLGWSHTSNRIGDPDLLAEMQSNTQRQIKNRSKSTFLCRSLSPPVLFCSLVVVPVIVLSCCLLAGIDPLVRLLCAALWWSGV